MNFTLTGQGTPVVGHGPVVTPGHQYQIGVVTDPVKHVAAVTVGGVTYLSTTLSTDNRSVSIRSWAPPVPGLRS